VARKILVADNEEALRKNLERILAGKGYAVTAAANGREAEDILQREQYDLVICELRMPGIDGSALLKYIKDVRPETDVLIVSSIDSLQVAVDSLKNGACDYLLKPFEIEQVGIIVDKIFQRKKLETDMSIGRQEHSKIIELVKRMEDVDNLKKDIIATVAHELNTPITNLGGYIHLLDEEKIGKLNGSQRKAVAAIKEQFKRLQRMVQNTVDLVIKKDAVITSSRVDLIKLVDRMIDFVSDDAAKSRVAVTRECADAYMRADVDVERIEEVFYHLLVNAIKFNRAGGSVTVVMRKIDNRQAVIDVRDTGIGIPAREFDKIFDKFYQVDHSITRPYKGAGLGLAIVKLYTELHGGTVTLKSAVGAGTTFTVTLPLK
jgi:signal transduction histidine kinase